MTNREIALEQVEIQRNNLLAAELNQVRAIKLARDVGVSWDDIATALGMSRQNAQKRYARLVGEPNPKVRRAAQRMDDYGNGGPQESPP